MCIIDIIQSFSSGLQKKLVDFAEDAETELKTYRGVCCDVPLFAQKFAGFLRSCAALLRTY